MAKDKRLLIVDDDLAGIELMKEVFQAKGINTVMVKDMPAALGEIENTSFDLIIIDIGLAGKETGLDLLKEIRKTDKEVKIFILTGYGDAYRQEAYNLGADCYLEKPLNIDEYIYKPLGVE